MILLTSYKRKYYTDINSKQQVLAKTILSDQQLLLCSYVTMITSHKVTYVKIHRTRLLPKQVVNLLY